MRVGLISDTHGLLRPEAVDFLRGSNLIVHTGDVCSKELLDELASIAPTVAVRGNHDNGPWAARLARTEFIYAGDVILYAVHDLADLDIDPSVERVSVVVHGHSHQPSIVRRGHTIFVNPGSAGPRRFKLPVAVGELIVNGSVVSARVVDLTPEIDL